MAEKQAQAEHAGATRLWWLTVLGTAPLHAYGVYYAVQMIPRNAVATYYWSVLWCFKQN